MRNYNKAFKVQHNTKGTQENQEMFQLLYLEMNSVGVVADTTTKIYPRSFLVIDEPHTVLLTVSTLLVHYARGTSPAC